MRLIDADKIIPWYSENYGVSTAILSNLLFLQEIVKNMPTVDANPVIHAHWIESSDHPDTLECSHCGKRLDMYFYDKKDFKYCNNCNAVMDE